MISADDIKDRETLEAWLEARPEASARRDAMCIAYRAAMRVMPVYVSSLDSDWARKIDLTGLPILRCNLTAGVACISPTPAVRDAASAAADSAADSAAYPAARAAYPAARAAYPAARAAYAADSAAAYAAAAEIWDSVRVDALRIEGGADPLKLPLWSDRAPQGFEAAWTGAQDWLAAHPGHAFWIRWYQAALHGRPLTGDWRSHWQMMEEIALIPNSEWPDEDWINAQKPDRAPHIAGLIDLITQKLALQQEVKRLRTVLEHEAFNAMTLGHHRDNLPDDMPPSPIVAYRAQLTELEAALAEVELALEPPVPDVVVMEEATGRLRVIWAKIKQYPLAAGFVVLMGATATGAAGQLGVRGMDWVIDQGLPSLVRSLREIAPPPNPQPPKPQGWEKPAIDV